MGGKLRDNRPFHPYGFRHRGRVHFGIDLFLYIGRVETKKGPNPPSSGTRTTEEGGSKGR